MKTRTIYTILHKETKEITAYSDLTQTASILGIHVNTLRYKLKQGPYEDNIHLAMISSLYLSNRGKK